MTRISSLPVPIRASLERQYLRRIDDAAATRHVRVEATRRLQSRFAHWHGAPHRGESARFKNKVPIGVHSHCVMRSDEPELIIVRVLAITKGAGQFTVSPDGTVNATENNGNTREKIRVPVGGLSPLVDDASYIFNQIRDREGGRMFFTQDGKFITGDGRLTFLTVKHGSELKVVSSTLHHRPIRR